MLPTLAFAPRQEDLEEDFFAVPIMAFTAPSPQPDPRRPTAAPHTPRDREEKTRKAG